AGAGGCDLADDFLEAGGEPVLGRAAGGVALAVPDVVDADVDDHERRLPGEDVALDALLQVGHLVAADAGAEARDVQVLVPVVQGLLDEGDVAHLAGAGGGDGVAEEDDALALLQRHGGVAGAGPTTGQAGDEPG